ncbi:alpha/beta hydrolase [Natroniella acetigena]|uniref:lipase family alpha/beta hydrolase n=1 Tax=Natroniella acetigena TaxID=52004 RepID=UPI00200A4DCB|nr:alpha/beta hydrolase [Natroniella acetigena]MCK8826597.1 alpha/beta hydrolase [Natroniella acetigena]
MKQKVILVHGYNKDQSDMLTLKNNLEKESYQGILVDLPLRFEELKDATKVFATKVEKIINELEEGEEISFIGHSTGGLVIRYFLSKSELKFKLGRVVLIATPNQGSRLAEIASTITPFTSLFKTLDSLQPEQLKELDLSFSKEIEVGAIAGNKNNLLLGELLEDENDGRVRVDSVRCERLSDFIVLPYGHKEIHHQRETAKVAANFLREGKFLKE